jgi:23S rRNA (adenine2503-C2)-methyltransferase
MNISELTNELSSIGLQLYRIRQIYSWLQKNGVDSYDEMSNVPKNLREILLSKYNLLNCKTISKQVSEVDETTKYLFKLFDGEYVESVLMKYKYGYSLCVSTQAGCRMKCKFCATANGGLARNLKPSEILAQIHTVQKDLNIRISHIVLMGMGEPLDNYKNVIRFIELVTDENGLNISMRSISVSTCGIVPAIYMLMKNKYQFTLSISLHAPNNKIRSEIMPVNEKYSITSLMTACNEYALYTSRRVSIEYALFEGINDSQLCANQLSSLLKGIHCHLNLIPANTVAGNQFVRSNSKTVRQFADILKSNHINVTIRRSLGSDIDASCGQLKRRSLEQISQKQSEAVFE